MIPAAYGPLFLEWFRARTERAWATMHTRELAEYERAGVGGAAWQRGTRWTGGLAEEDIASVEERHGVRFPPDHRLFLQLLHSTTPHCSGARFIDGEHMVAVERPGFYDWRRDEAEIRAARAGIVDGLLFDVENNVLWLPSWGTRPHDAGDRRARVAELVARAPPLLPILGHRFVLAEGPTLVLSVHQSDIIIYGRDLRAYLLEELHELLGIPSVPTSEDVDVASIPFWGELLDPGTR